jgi:RimJ/RimL family protein N-acetyltransferase/8-oxo-dGTP pyrophosphatase MutT (NUDIX family)
MQITATDIYGEKYTAEAEKLTCRPGIYAVVIRDNSVLIAPQHKGLGYDFVGGRIELGENHLDALKRECREESGFEIEPREIIALNTNFWYKNADKIYHCLRIYFSGEIIGGDFSMAEPKGSEKTAAPSRFVMYDELRLMHSIAAEPNAVTKVTNYLAKHLGGQYGYIETERLVLREWTASDLPAITDGLNNENVAKYLSSVPFPYTIDNAKEFFNSHNKNTRESMAFAITLRKTGEVIGGCGVKLKSNGVWSGGIWLNEKYHGKGYGTEAYRARTKFMFDICGARDIESGYYFDNIPSKKMHDKIGFRSSGRTEIHKCPARNGSEVLCHISAIRKSWLK